MKEEKILQEEILSDDELENVAGGTVNELEDLTRAFIDNSTLNIVGALETHIPGANKILANTIEKGLKDMGIEAHISIGFLGTGLASDPNTYKDMSTGKSLTHQEVVNIIKNY